MPLSNFLHDSHEKRFLHEGWTVSLVDSDRSEQVPVSIPELAAQVPGCVHLDLMEAKLIPDPFYGMNEKSVAWVSEQDWSWKTTFTIEASDIPSAEGDRLQLVFEGIDTVADILLDGELLASVDNMFVAQRIDLPRDIQAGVHSLEVRITSPMEAMRQRKAIGGPAPSSLDDDRGWVRKEQCSYGWDWGPILPSSGLYRPVYLQKWTDGRIAWYNTQYEQQGKKGLLTVQCVVQLDNAGKGTLAANLKHDGSEASAEASFDVDRPGEVTLTFQLELSDPKLWWPAGQGDPFLYDLELTLAMGGRIVHRASDEVGLRTVEWVQQKDAWGESFFLRLNGRDIFVKGANWIPTDSFLPRADAARYERQVDLAVESNMNLLRVWGGGMYEDPAFYRAADRKGIMIWQDFPYACAFYPDTPEFLIAARKEAEAAVAELNHHPSIVLWCGNNEIERDAVRFQREWGVRYLGEVIWKGVLPEVVQRMAPGAFYWQSSPDGGSEPNSIEAGDRHVWSVWSGWGSEDAYLTEEGRFISEFGFQAPPDIETLREVVPKAEWFPQSETVEWHNKQIEGPERLQRFLAARHRVTQEMDRFVRLSQEVQGSALRKALEHWRRRRPRTMGGIIWQLNDCWQVASWALIDYRLRPKASFYQVQRAFAPRGLTLLRNGGQLELWAMNDTTEEWNDPVLVKSIGFDGTVVKEERHLPHVPAGDVVLVDTIDVEQWINDPRKQVIVAEAQGGYENPIRAAYTKNPPKHLDLDGSGLSVIVENRHEAPGVRIKARSYMPSIWLSSPENPDIWFDDNSFDLLPGEERWIGTRHVQTGEPKVLQIVTAWTI